MVLDELDVPIVLAPMAGAPGTPALARAVSDAGGLGFVPAGYKTADAVREELDACGARTIGVGLFVPPAAPADPALVAAYARRLEGPLGEPRSDDDGWEAKLALLVERPPAVVSFAFGCPPPDVIAALPCEVWVTVTTPAEASLAVAAGADAVVAQGTEAGGHRGGFADDHPGIGLLALLQAIDVRVPVIATGGIATRRGLAAALAAGAAAAQVGTAFLLTPEAGTVPAHRDAVASSAPTALTRAFTGRTARGIVNAFLRRHDAFAPAAYPEVHHLTKPLRRDADTLHLWAGEAHALARAVPAAEVVAQLR